jgi:hypothetical protein
VGKTKPYRILLTIGVRIVIQVFYIKRLNRDIGYTICFSAASGLPSRLKKFLHYLTSDDSSPHRGACYYSVRLSCLETGSPWDMGYYRENLGSWTRMENFDVIMEVTYYGFTYSESGILLPKPSVCLAAHI